MNSKANPAINCEEKHKKTKKNIVLRNGYLSIIIPSGISRNVQGKKVKK